MTDQRRDRRGVSRRTFLSATVGAAGGTVFGGTSPRPAEAFAQTPAPVRGSLCDDSRDLLLVNGRFLTFDTNNRVASSVAIRDGRIVAVGDNSVNLGPCARRIDLKGATVIPGLIDSHVHFIRDGLNPGHEARIIEVATSIPEMQRMITARIKALGVPAGEFITCVGGWNANGLAEKRMPTLAELDAAAPAHPVYLSTTGAGGGVTNTPGKAFFDSKGVMVDAVGALNAAMGFAALRAAQNAGDRRVSTWMKGTEEAIAFASSLGLTTVHDVGGNGNLFVDLRPYDEVLTLWREGRLNMRIRSFLYSDTDTGFGIARARMDNQLNRIGDDIFRHLGVGERVNVSTTDPGFIEHCEYAAAHGWTVQQHSSTQEEIALHIRAYQAGNAKRPIRDLRWSLTHVNTITAGQLDALVAMGTGVTVQGTPYTGGNAGGGNGGAPFRLILDRMGAARIPVGGGSDATNVAALNPWLMMSFMATGKNNAGVVINAGGAQTCSRLDALRMYTVGSAYYSFDDRLGSIEPGKLADMAVLSDDPLTVSDGAFKTLRSVMTLQGGRVVHGAPP